MYFYYELGHVLTDGTAAEGRLVISAIPQRFGKYTYFLQRARYANFGQSQASWFPQSLC